jgi:hypothetical protein
MSNKNGWKEINPAERKRTYKFGETEVTIEGVNRLRVSTSGNHYLETADGGRFIVRAGWDVIDLDIDDWAF